jgi:hypothetical protein
MNPRLARCACMVLVLALGAAACSQDTDPSAGGTEGTTTSTSAPAGPLTPIAALPAAAERWSYLPTPVTATVPVPDTAAERAELQTRRDVAARPRPPGSDDRFIRVGEGTPTRFMDLAVDVGRRRALNPMRMARHNALIAVAGHEAALAAARTAVPAGQSPKQVDAALGEPVGGVDSLGVELPDGTLPPEIVTATAQRKVACSIYPVECPRFERLNEIARNRLIASGAVWPSTIDAATALGESVGDAVIAQGASDGATPWVASPTDLPPGGEWKPTPGAFAPALEPFAGSWRPWNLTSGDQFRPAAPPAAGSPEHVAATQQVFDEGTNISDRALRIANFWDMGPGTSTPPGYWVSDVEADAFRQAPAADQAAALALLATAELDAGIATWDAKYAYRTVRPVTTIRSSLAPQWLPSLQTPAFPAYVSGHSAFTATAAEILSVLRPERAEEFMNAAAEASDSRLTGGIHYWYDLVAGSQLGKQVGDAALQRAGLQPAQGLTPVTERMRYTSADVRTRPAS